MRCQDVFVLNRVGGSPGEPARYQNQLFMVNEVRQVVLTASHFRSNPAAMGMDEGYFTKKLTATV